MGVAAVPNSIIKSASAADFIRSSRSKAGEYLKSTKGRLAPVGLGLAVGLGLPAAINFILNTTNKTHGLNQFIAESRKKKQLNDQIELLNRIANNTGMARRSGEAMAAEPSPRYTVAPVVPYYQPKRIS